MTPNARLGSPKMMLSKGAMELSGQVSDMCAPVMVRSTPSTANAADQPSARMGRRR
jgi:hypothetical protein